VSWPKAACASLLGLATKAIRSYRAGLVMASGAGPLAGEGSAGLV
jgi:hypothetical protein